MTSDGSAGGGVTEALPSLCEFRGRNLTETSVEFQELLESISEFLRVDSVNTSQSRRKKESAQDHRASSVSLGLFSCSLIFVAVSLLAFSDIASCLAIFVEYVRAGLQPTDLSYTGK
ncbi:hypothetical protein ElyMa_004827100 [Elysia marginata]|uniref:Uncharacterized protein n=1 Tax=Elysia marginata TaxID=1093978 RepID=A0AAV4IRF8_9GAST|nr:hypothetical protein ElyMa_004827100 [Elysia marginata]